MLMIFNMAAGRNENTAKKKSKNTPKRFWKGADKNIRTGNKKTGIGLRGVFFHFCCACGDYDLFAPALLSTHYTRLGS